MIGSEMSSVTCYERLVEAGIGLAIGDEPGKELLECKYQKGKQENETY